MSKTKEQQPAYISRVHLKGYKSIRDLEIDFKAGLNIIIGPNGSGKTNFLKALAQILLTNQLENFNNFSGTIDFYDYFGKGDSYNSESTKNGFKASLKSENFNIDMSNQKMEKLFESNPSNFFDYFQQFAQLQEQLRKDNNTIFFPILINHGVRDFLTLLDRDAKITISFDKKSVEYHFYNAPFENDFSNEIDFEKQTLKSYTQKKLINSLKIKNELLRSLHNFSPIKDVRIREPFVFTKHGNTIIADFLLLEFKINNEWFTWKDLSDGTKRIFYILAEVISTKGLVLLEEPELGIHPDQLYLLMDFLKEQSNKKQIIITTHSPEVLNILEKNELLRIVVTSYDTAKGTKLHHLSPHKVKKGQMYMDKVGYLSDFWVHSNLEEYEAEEYEIE